MAAPTLELPQNLANDIAKQLIGTPAAVSAADVSGVKSKFCELWPTAKQVLGILKDIIPGGGIVIGIVIALGDGAQKAFCT
jgi:hypothetical protein